MQIRRIVCILLIALVLGQIAAPVAAIEPTNDGGYWISEEELHERGSLPIWVELRDHGIVVHPPHPIADPHGTRRRADIDASIYPAAV